jgi:hypothetical protein
MELVVEAKHLGQFLVGETMPGEQLPCAFDAPHEGMAGRRFAGEDGEFFSKTLVAHAASLGDGAQCFFIIRRRPLQKVHRLREPGRAPFFHSLGAAGCKMRDTICCHIVTASSIDWNG